jgi:putative two-component system response regulator
LVKPEFTTMDENALSGRTAGAGEEPETLQEALDRTRRALIQTVHAVSLVAGLGDSYTARHQEQVAALALAVGRRLGLEEHRLEGLYLGALIHDVGKVAVPSSLLTKVTKLTPEEFAVIRTHVRVGVELLGHVTLPWPVQAIVGQHHERLDGSGYPAGLSGDAIIVEARITAVADVFEAMCEPRSYRGALGQEAALAELERGCGVTVDRDAVGALRSLLRDAGPQDIWTYLKADQLGSTVILPRYRATPSA